MAERVGGKLERLALDELEPDWENPRYLPGAVANLKSADELFVYLDSQYDAFSVADSIARHGFFESEPLIAIPSTRRGRYIVVEGNRRLAALNGLANPKLRQKLAAADSRWNTLPDDVELQDDYPVLLVDDRKRVAPILGFRHVTGIAPWDPYQQARYIASLIDGEQQMSAAQVADLIGRDLGEVRSFYRNYSIVEQAEDVFKLDDPKRIVDEFGVWNRAMTSTGIRSYIRAPAPRDVTERDYPLDDDVQDELANLITWIFGVPRSKKDRDEGKQSKDGRAINDSRQLNRLGKAIVHPKGRAALESGAKLPDAEKAMRDERAQFTEALAEAQDALETAAKHRPKKLSKQAVGTLDALAELVEQIRQGDGDTAD